MRRNNGSNMGAIGGLIYLMGMIFFYTMLYIPLFLLSFVLKMIFKSGQQKKDELDQ